MPRIATMASPSMLPPVCPTLIPRLLIKLSTFWDTFRKAMAQRNQMKIFPVTAALPSVATCCCTSSSVRAAAGTTATQDRMKNKAVAKINGFIFFIIPPIFPKDLPGSCPP